MDSERIAQHALIQELIEHYASEIIADDGSYSDCRLAILARAWVIVHGGSHDQGRAIVMSRVKAYMEVE